MRYSNLLARLPRHLLRGKAGPHKFSRVNGSSDMLKIPLLITKADRSWIKSLMLLFEFQLKDRKWSQSRYQAQAENDEHVIARLNGIGKLGATIWSATGLRGDG